MADQTQDQTSPASPQTPSGFAIRVRSYEVFNGPGLGSAVHNEIIFENNGQVVASFNGNPWKRETGQMNYPGVGDNNTLRVNVMPGQTIADVTAPGKFPVLGTQTLYAGNDPARFAEMLGRATEAATFINAQNLDYIMVDPLRVGQNSNSVAHTLTEAMGLRYPPETENLWAPGHGRNLLPTNFRSVFDDIKNKPDWLTDPATQVYITAMGTRLDELGSESVGAQVLRDPKHPNAAPPTGAPNERPQNVPTFFNPDAPVAWPEFIPPAAQPTSTSPTPKPKTADAAAP